jgi:S-DNA-T family DNA segregation ATPase FtsK/SpoIIIE
MLELMVRPIIRHGYVAAYGHTSWARRAFAAATYGVIREQIRLAHAAGDAEALAVWQDRLHHARDARHDRMRNLPTTITRALLALLVVVTVLAGILVTAGVVFELTPGGLNWGSWWTLLADIGGVLAAVLALAVHVALWAAGPLWLYAAWREGRRAASVPVWLVSPAERAQNIVITADAITAALAAIKITALAKSIQSGVPLTFIVAPREQGGGTYCQVRLPIGVMAADVLGSSTVERLAANLHRHKHEVWPQRDPSADAAVLDLWIADKGAMDRPAPPWPLLHDGVVDVWRDQLPWGVTMRSEQVSVGMLQKHWLVGATSKQGKTTTVRLLALGLALDPTVELLIADLKGDGDWSMFADRARVLIEGSADEDAEATCQMLEWAVGEMRRRYEVKTAKNLTLTRELSRRKGSGFHPIYVIVDECQILYAAPHPVGGTKDDARAWRAAKRLHDQARAVNIHLIQATQRPDNRTLPVQVREGEHVRAALNVPNAETAKMILADAADRGARPQDLRPGRDAGTVVATGEVEDIPAGQAFTIVRTHYVNGTEAAEVVKRSVELRRKHGMVDTPEPALEKRDFLDDVQTVMEGVDRVKSTDILQRLKERWEAVYGGWSSVDFSDALKLFGVEIRQGRVGPEAGQRYVAADDVRHAMKHPATIDRDS